MTLIDRLPLHPEPRCCVNGLDGWHACPNEWDCPTQTPTVRLGFLAKAEVGAGMRALEHSPSDREVLVDEELLHAGILLPINSTRFRHDEKTRVEYLAYLYDQDMRRSGNVDPKIDR